MTEKMALGCQQQPARRPYSPSAALGTCCESEGPSWTPRLQGKASWFPVSAGPWTIGERQALFSHLGEGD